MPQILELFLLVHMGSRVNPQVGNGLDKIFNFRSQNSDVSDQAVFILAGMVNHYEEGNIINISDPLTVAQRRFGRFFLSLLRST